MECTGRIFLSLKCSLLLEIKPINQLQQEKKNTTHPTNKKNLNLATNTKHLHRMGDRIILFYPHASQSLCSHVSDIIQKCFQYGHFHSLTSEAFY